MPSGQTVTHQLPLEPAHVQAAHERQWGGTTGTISLSNDSVSGEPSNVTTSFKLAFKGKSVEQVRKGLIVGATGSTGAGIIQPIAAG